MSKFDSLIIGEVAQDTNVDYDGTVVKAVGGAVYYSGFAAANMNAMIFPMIVGKLIGGVTAIGVAMMLVPKEDATATKTEAEAQS